MNFSLEEYHRKQRAEREEIKKLVRELRKLIPNHKFRIERGCNNGIVIDERHRIYKNDDEKTVEALKNYIIIKFSD